MGNTPELKRLIPAVLLPKPSYAASKEFITFCHQVALAYIRTKSFSHTYLLQKLAVSANDLAFDAIADLFRRNDEDTFTELSRYFAHVGPLEARSEDALLTDTRRLVLGAVNRRIFRLYRASDPALSKLIRNLKLALRDHKLLKYETRGGDGVVRVRMKSDSREDLPIMPPELILPELLTRIPHGATAREIVDGVGTILIEEKEYRGMISLVGLALIARAFYSSGMVATDGDAPTSTFSHDEIASLAKNVVSRLKADTVDEYGRKKKLNSERLHAYLESIQEILLLEFDGSDSARSSYFEILQRHYGGLTEAEYKSRHRVVLEYFARIAKAEMRKDLKKELQIP